VLSIIDISHYRIVFDYLIKTMIIACIEFI